MNKMQSLSYSNLESHRGGKDRSKSNSKQRDNERGAIKEHLGGVGQAGVGQFQVGLSGRLHGGNGSSTGGL